RDQADQRRFARAGAADDGSDLAWPGAEANVVEGGLFRSGIAEGDILELDIPLHLVGLFHLLGIFDFRLHRQHFVDAVRGGRGAREHDKQHRDHQQPEQYLHSILQECDECTDLHLVIVDANSTEPENSDARDVQNQHHNWHEPGNDPVDANRHVGYIEVGLVKAPLSMSHAVDRADDAHSAQARVQNENEFIELHLHHDDQRHGITTDYHNAGDQ